MPIRMTGLISGLDTDSVVKELMSAQSLKKTKIEQKKTKEEWKQDKWKELNTKLYALYTEKVGKLKLQSSYMTKKVTSSNESAITATATTTAATGSHTVQVNQLASSQYLTSSSVLKGKTAGDTLQSCGLSAGTNIEIKVGKDGETKTFTVESGSTITDFVNALKDAGLNASFDASQGRLFISSKESGADNVFSITSSSISGNDDYNTAVTGLQDAGASMTAINSYYKALQSGNDEDIAKAKEELEKEIKTAKAAEAKEIVANTYIATELVEGSDKYQNIVATVDAEYDSLMEKAKAALTEKAIAAEKEANGEEAVADLSEAEKDELYNKYIAANYENNEEAALLDNGAKTKAELLETAIKKAGDEYAASEEAQPEIDEYISQNYYGLIETYGNAIAGTSVGGTNALTGLGLANIVDGKAQVGGDPDAVVIEAQDAEIVLDGATLTGSSNTFTAAGITFDLKDTTVTRDASGAIVDAKSITMNVSNDIDAVYDTIKDFFKEYNSILKEMNTLYNASSSRGYDPLTDEEKEAMSEEQIELWENKIKDSLLRRDTTLGSLMNAMKSAMQTTITAKDGQTYSLSSFGIMTSTDYTEGGLLHIYGDEEDATYSTYTDKLKSALNSDPDAVIETLSGIITNLSNTMADKMKKTSLSSALTFYNDIQIKNSISDYEDEIDKWEDRLEEIENRYYDQFSAMEKAMATLQSQSSYLSSLMGTSA